MPSTPALREPRFFSRPAISPTAAAVIRRVTPRATSGASEATTPGRIANSSLWNFQALIFSRFRAETSAISIGPRLNWPSLALRVSSRK